MNIIGWASIFASDSVWFLAEVAVKATVVLAVAWLAAR